MKSYPEYVVEDESMVRFAKRVTKRNSDMTTNQASDSSSFSALYIDDEESKLWEYSQYLELT
jgi:hypothetical protein